MKKDIFDKIMNQVCHDVEIEPKPGAFQGKTFVNNSTTTEDEAQLDIKANELWGFRFSRAFFEVKNFHSHAENCIKTHTNITKR